MSNCHLALTDSLKFSVVNRLKNRATFPLQSTPEGRAELSRNAARTNRCTHITHGFQFGENTFTINPAFTGKFHMKML